MGVVTALQFAPVLALSAWAGLLADRLPRRRLLMATQGAMGLLALGLGWSRYVLMGIGVVVVVALALSAAWETLVAMAVLLASVPLTVIEISTGPLLACVQATWRLPSAWTQHHAPR